MHLRYPGRHPLDRRRRPRGARQLQVADARRASSPSRARSGTGASTRPAASSIWPSRRSGPAQAPVRPDAARRRCRCEFDLQILRAVDAAHREQPRADGRQRRPDAARHLRSPGDLRPRRHRARRGDVRGPPLPDHARHDRLHEPDRIEPFFDVEAETNVRVPGQTYRVTVGAAGTTEQLRPTLELGSAAADRRRAGAAVQRRAARPAPQDWRPSCARCRTRTQAQTDILTTRATQAITGRRLVGGGEGRRADVRRRHVPAHAVVRRSVQPADVAPQPDGAAHDRQAHFRSRLPDVLAQPQHDRPTIRSCCSRSTRAIGSSWILSRNEDSADLRARVPREARRSDGARLHREDAMARDAIGSSAFLVRPLRVWPATARAPTSPTTSASRSGRSGWSIEGRDTTDAAADPGRSKPPVGQPLSMAAGAREHHASVQPRPVRERARRRDARERPRRAALRAQPDSSGRQDPLRRPADAPGIDEDALRRAIVDRYGASPPLGRAADMTRIVADALARARLSARRRSRRAPISSTIARTRHAGVHDRSRRADDDRRRSRSSASRRCRAPSFCGRLGARARRAVSARRARRTASSGTSTTAGGAGYYDARIVPDRAAGRRRSRRQPHARPSRRARTSASCSTGDPLPADRRDELVPVEREGSVDEDLLEDSSNRIEEFLRAQGYRDARAPHTRAERERRAGDHVHGDAGSAVPGGQRSRSRATPRCRSPSSTPSLTAARRPAVLGGAARRRRRRRSRSCTTAAASPRRGRSRRSNRQPARRTPAQVPVVVRIVDHRRRADDRSTA